MRVATLLHQLTSPLPVSLGRRAEGSTKATLLPCRNTGYGADCSLHSHEALAKPASMPHARVFSRDFQLMRIIVSSRPSAARTSNPPVFNLSEPNDDSHTL